MWRGVWSFGFLGLTACSTGLLDARVPPNPSPGFVPDANGLADIGTGMRIDFSRSPEGVVPTLDRVLGRHTTLPLTGCPANIRQNLLWGDLTLAFTDEQFVGWQQAGASAGQVCASPT